MFRWGEKKRQRLLHNARCRRYYQRHLSKEAREKELRKSRRKALKRSITHEDTKKGEDTKNYFPGF